MNKLTRLFVLAIILTHATFAGTITMDGSLPGTVAVSGSTYTISSGKQSGVNQFYSFSQLNLVKGDIASFSATTGVSSVFARVTGGQSSIDGTISAPGASFYLINNQGVIFGPDASLDVGGAFVVTTADELKFADGKVFTATPSGSDATLSTAAPSAFGFLSSQPAPVTINGSTLITPPGQQVAIAAGTVTIQGGKITSNGGAVAITSVGSSGSAVFNGSVGSAPDVSSFSQLGTVQITGSSAIDVDGPAGGGITVRARSLTLTASFLSAQTTGAGNGLGIGILLSGDLNVTGSGVNTSTSGSGNAGNISLVAGNITISGVDTNVPSSDPLLAFLGASIESISNGNGAAGNITLTADGNVTLTDRARLESTSFSLASATGESGNITVSAKGAFTTIGPNTADTDTGNPFDPITGVVDYTNNMPGGDVNITAGSFSMLNGGSSILNDTFGAGNGGNVKIVVHGPMILRDAQDTLNDFGVQITTDTTSGAGNAGNLSITAASLVVDGGVGSSNIATNSGSSGNSGTVSISTGSLTIQNGGVIFAQSNGSGSSGGVIINSSSSVLFDGGTSMNETGVFNPPSPLFGVRGTTGFVTVDAASLTIQNGAQIVTSSLGNVAAGNITVDVSGNVMLDGSSDSLGRSGIIAEASGSGAGGAIIVSAGTLFVQNGAEISTSTTDTGNAGSVTLNCGSLVMKAASIEAESTGAGAAGSVVIQTAQSATISSASVITVSAPQSNGGDIDLVDGYNLLIDHSAVSAFAADLGGNITLDAPNLITVANSIVDGRAGISGGLITIDPQFVIIGPDSVVNGLSNGQDVLVTIQPSGGFLLSGDSQILTNRQEFNVNNDIVASLSVLQASLADVNAQLAPTCAMFASGNSST